LNYHAKKSGESAPIAIISGFAEVLGDRVTVLAETAERPEEIDLARAEEAKKRAEQRLAAASTDPDVDWSRAAIALQRSLIRIQVARKRHSVMVPGE
jgi:F-type H+-transporting ATPase subunit epsilon